jgi:hypothetical protein
MSRPQPTILAVKEQLSGERWEILLVEKSYIITYKGQPVSVRTEQAGLGQLQRKYKKMSYANIGNCRAQVNKLNEIFNCDDFGFAVWPA